TIQAESVKLARVPVGGENRASAIGGHGADVVCYSEAAPLGEAHGIEFQDAGARVRAIPGDRYPQALARDLETAGGIEGVLSEVAFGSGGESAAVNAPDPSGPATAIYRRDPEPVCADIKPLDVVVGMPDGPGRDLGRHLHAQKGHCRQERYSQMGQ